MVSLADYVDKFEDIGVGNVFLSRSSRDHDISNGLDGRIDVCTLKVKPKGHIY